MGDSYSAMSDDDDMPPPLEDMSETLSSDHMRKVHEAQGDTSAAVHVPALNSANPPATFATATAAAATAAPARAAGTDGGLKKGFLNSKPKKKRETRKQSQEKEKEKE